MLEKEIAERFQRKIDRHSFFSKSLVRLSPAEIDLVLLDKSTHELISYEFKRNNWKKAFLQALRNKLYCHYSYVVLPEKEMLSIVQDEFHSKGIGLITYQIKGNGLHFKEILKPLPSALINRQLKKQVYQKFNVYTGSFI